MQELIVHGLYTIKDGYFEEFGNGYWVDNKNERRPYYFLLEDTDGVKWVIPLSSQVENYKNKIAREEAKRGKGNCLYYHIGVVAGRENVFLIGDMFPVDNGYIKAAFRIKNVHYVSKNKNLNAALYSKAMRFLKLVSGGYIQSRNDILGIKAQLIARKCIIDD